MKRGVLEQLRQACRDRAPAALLTWLEGGAQQLWMQAHDNHGLAPALQEATVAAMTDGRSVLVESDEGQVFIHVHLPAPRLLVVGAVHISQALAPMAARAGFEVRIIDPRRWFASEERFAGVTVDRRWPDEALRALAPDPRSAVVTLTHDAKLDDAALKVALASEAFYIASLGSRRTHAKRLARLREAGFDDDALARIHAPAGLDIGAVGSAEIAVSVLAQVVAVMRGAAGA